MPCLVESALRSTFTVCLTICKALLHILTTTVELGRVDSLAAIGKRGLSARELEEEANQLIGDGLEHLWKRAEESV